MDLAPLVQQMAVRIEHAVFLATRESGRTADDSVLAALLALATSAAALRSAFDIPVEVWAECNRIAQSPSSLLSLLPPQPAAVALQNRLAFQAKLNLNNG